MPKSELHAIFDSKAFPVPSAVREWCQLAANWKTSGLNVWIPPNEISVADGVLWLLTDPERITMWGFKAEIFT